MRKLLLGLFFGLLTQAAFAQAPGSLPGCQYNATPPTLSDKQTTVWQCDSSGKLITSSTANPNTVIGPGATITSGAAVVWDGTSGTLVKDSKIVLTVPAATTTLTLGSGKTVTISNTLTFTGTDSSTLAIGTGGTLGTAAYQSTGTSGATIPFLNGTNVFTNLTSIQFGTSSTILLDAANTLALRNSTTAQTFNVYGTFTDASNKDYISITKAAGGAAVISTIGVGTGTGNDLIFGVPITSGAGIAATNVWKIVAGGASAGSLLAVTDNTYDIGASGATRPRNLYVAANIQAGGTITVGDSSILGWSIATGVYGNASSGVGTGALRILFGGTSRHLNFGGDTSASPALNANGIKLEAKLADDSTYASFAARGLIVAGAVPTLALAGGTCAGTVIAGGSTAGTVTLTGVCVATNTMALTVMPTAPTGYACDAIDRTLGSSLLTETATTATSVTFTFGGTTGATDVLAYKCLAY